MKKVCERRSHAFRPTKPLTLPTHVLQPHRQNFVRIFCNDSKTILLRISALCLTVQAFVSEKHLKEFPNQFI